MSETIAVIGLGYVGLPLAVALGEYFTTIGFDINPEKIAAYQQQRDPVGQIQPGEFAASKRLQFTSEPADLAAADVLIVAVPTPVDNARKPDFGPLLSASRLIAPHLKSGAIVVYESTVYPGATEEVCVPALEAASGKQHRRDFFVGYSPERINPGDTEHTLTKITKVVSGDTPETLEKLAAVYGRIITAGIHRASSIKVAEAAKVIENTQRDLNIALMNELAIIFNRLDIDTEEVIQAAQTKWNFLPFRPGLVGGHCVGVDPYYLTHKAEMVDYHAQVILAGRRINDGMGEFIAEQTVKTMTQASIDLRFARVTVLGLTFKENCPDLRNSKVADILKELANYNIQATVCDPLADPREAYEEYGVELTPWEQLPPADAMILAVPHKEFLSMTTEELTYSIKRPGCFIDVKSKIDKNVLKEHNIAVWRL